MNWKAIIDLQDWRNLPLVLVAVFLPTTVITHNANLLWSGLLFLFAVLFWRKSEQSVNMKAISSNEDDQRRWQNNEYLVRVKRNLYNCFGWVSIIAAIYFLYLCTLAWS